MQRKKDKRSGSKWDDMMGVILKMDKLFAKYTKQKYSELGLVRHLYECAEIRGFLQQWIDLLETSETRAVEITNAYRAKGNEMYKNVYTRGAEAIDYYTKAIFSAPKYSKELGLAHANRAASLIALDFYEEAYNDCEMAKINFYPEENLLKVLLRQASCSAYLKRSYDLARNIYEIERNISRYNLKSHLNRVEELKTELKKLKTNCQRESTVESKTTIIRSKEIIEKSSQNAGRYIIAGEDIKTNEPIIEESAFAFIPVYRKYDENYIDWNCQNCAKTNIIPFPCYECGRASYCCPNCRDAHRSIHQYECIGYAKNLWLEIGIAHLSIRTVLIGFPKLIDQFRFLTDASVFTILNGFNRMAEVDPSFQYANVLRLVHNLDKMEEEDVFRYSLTAAMLTVYLKSRTTFFEDIPNDYIRIMSNRFEWEKLVNVLILMHMGQLVCNGHAISDLALTPPTAINCLHSKDTVRLGMLHCYISSERIFTAIFPKISLLNHSCDSNIRNKFNGNALTVFATRNINKNEEIFNCYGPNYKLMERQDRQMALKQQYGFDCTCNKCKDKEAITIEVEPYICQDFNCRTMIPVKYAKGWWRNDMPSPLIRCGKCGHVQNFDWVLMFNKLIERMHTASLFGDLCNQACDMYQNVTRFMSENSEQKMDMAMILLSNSVLLTGNERKFDLNKKLLKISKEYLKNCEKRFGKFSLECVVASAFLLDLLAIRRKINEYFEPEYDLDQITTAAVEILSNSSKVLFVNYIKNYILCD